MNILNKNTDNYNGPVSIEISDKLQAKIRNEGTTSTNKKSMMSQGVASASARMSGGLSAGVASQHHLKAQGINVETPDLHVLRSLDKDTPLLGGTTPV